MRPSKENALKLAAHPLHYARLFLRRLSVRLLSAARRTVSPHLEFAYFILTWRCNLSCEMCPQRGQAGIFKNDSVSSLASTELSVAEWKSIVEKIRRYGPTVQLFGGEPLLYNGAMELVRFIKESGLECRMVTNGTLLHSRAEELVSSGLDSIWLSLDGPKEIHDGIRKGHRVFEKVMEGVGAVNELKSARGVLHPEINVLFTIIDKNYLHLNDFLDALPPEGIGTIVFSHAIFINRGQYQRHESLIREAFGADSREWLGYILDTGMIDVEKMTVEIEKVKARRLPNVHFYPDLDPAMIRRYYENRAFSLDKKCYAPWLTAQFHPDGSLAICSDFRVGSMRESSFAGLWNNQVSQRFRSLLNKGKLPLCDRCCMIHRHSLFTE